MLADAIEQISSTESFGKVPWLGRLFFILLFTFCSLFSGGGCGFSFATVSIDITCMSWSPNELTVGLMLFSLQLSFLLLKVLRAASPVLRAVG
jgi:hypothetical protein